MTELVPVSSKVPAGYKAEQARAVCILVASGKTVKDAAQEAGVSARDVWRWAQQYSPFADALFRARSLAADALSDELLNVTEGENNMHRARIRSENLRWLISKLNPNRYGDRLALDVTEKVDVSMALQAARSRLARPIRDQWNAEDAQVIDGTAEKDGTPTDGVSGDADDLPEFLR